MESLLLVFLIATGIQVSILYEYGKILDTENYKHILFPTEITQAEAYDILQKCVLEIQKRLIVNLNNFKVAVVDKNGVKRLNDITSKSLLNYVPQ